MVLQTIFAKHRSLARVHAPKRSDFYREKGCYLSLYKIGWMHNRQFFAWRFGSFLSETRFQQKFVQGSVKYLI